MGRSLNKDVNHSVFGKLTEESAYWIGFMLADGCVASNTPVICLTLSELDSEHVQKFKDFLNLKTSCKSASVTSPQIVRDLAMYNVVPRKTYTCKVPDQLSLNRDFWRGMIDGDGTIGRYKHGCYIALTGTVEVCEEFLEFCKCTCLPYCKVKVTNRGKYAQVKVTKGAVEMIKLLYENAAVALTRKAEIARSIFNENK